MQSKTKPLSLNLSFFYSIYTFTPLLRYVFEALCIPSLEYVSYSKELEMIDIN
jgi:hypothetical protein